MCLPSTPRRRADPAFQAARTALRQDAAEWLAERFPGSFYRLAPGQLPTIELLLTGQYRPWGPVAKRSDIPGWAHVMDLSSWSGYWQCTTAKNLRLNDRHSIGLASEVRHTLVLAGIQQEVLTTAYGKHDLAETIALLESPATGLLARWSLTALLQELEEHMSNLQDAAERANRKRSARGLSEVQRQLLQSGLDSRIVVKDIVRYAEGPMWRFNMLEFSEVVPAAVGASLAETWQRGQIADGRRISQMEDDLREVLSTSAELAA